jgi:hypothetical protein
MDVVEAFRAALAFAPGDLATGNVGDRTVERRAFDPLRLVPRTSPFRKPLAACPPLAAPVGDAAVRTLLALCTPANRPARSLPAFSGHARPAADMHRLHALHQMGPGRNGTPVIPRIDGGVLRPKETA